MNLGGDGDGGFFSEDILVFKTELKKFSRFVKMVQKRSKHCMRVISSSFQCILK